MMIDFMGINAITVSFAPHPRYEKVHTFLNGYYAGSLFMPQIDVLFTDDAKKQLSVNRLPSSIISSLMS